MLVLLSTLVLALFVFLGLFFLVIGLRQGSFAATVLQATPGAIVQDKPLNPPTVMKKISVGKGTNAVVKKVVKSKGAIEIPVIKARVKVVKKVKKVARESKVKAPFVKVAPTATPKVNAAVPIKVAKPVVKKVKKVRKPVKKAVKTVVKKATKPTSVPKTVEDIKLDPEAEALFRKLTNIKEKD